MVQAENRDPMVIAIDGPSGSGKSTVARGLASRLAFGYLDTGAMYRAVTWLLLQQNRPLGELLAATDPLRELLSGATLAIATDPSDRRVAIAGADVTEIIRGDAVTAAVSAAAASPVVRAHLSALQRQLALAAVGAAGGAVVEGRDIGTAIFPDARLKIWLTASAEARGLRRAAEHSAGEPASSDVEQADAALARRDGMDAARAASPPHCADDARVMDTTLISADEVVAQILQLWSTVERPDAASSPVPGPHDDRHNSATGASR